ncbi:MAG: SprT family zinc-dependent metalloprotease [Alphaproteobacteria bacterium]
MPALRRQPVRRKSAPLTIVLDKVEKMVEVRIDHRARQLLLKISPNGHLELVLPPYVSRRDGIAFLEERRLWISQKLRHIPKPISLTIGAEIPILGTLYRVTEAAPCGRGVAWYDQRETEAMPLLCIAGRPEHVPRRLKDFLKSEARRLLVPIAEQHARTLGVSLHRIRFAETRQQWGSCTAAGDISFSWRLILAPEWVANYVVAHEVAHLCELNHSPEFWNLVIQLMGDRRTVVTAKAWLRSHGDSLHQYG